MEKVQTSRPVLLFSLIFAATVGCGSSCGRMDSKQEAPVRVDRPGEGSPNPTPAGPGKPGAINAPLALTADLVFVVNGKDGSISALDPVKGETLATYPLPKEFAFPHHMSLSPDGKTLAVAAPGMDLSGGHGAAMSGMRGAVVLVDVASGRIVASKKLAAMNHNAAYSKDGRYILTTLMADPGLLLFLDAVTLEAKSEVSITHHASEVTVSPDGAFAYVAGSAANIIQVVDIAARKVIKDVPVGKEPIGAWKGRDGLLYVDNEGGKSISVLSPLTLQVIRTYDLGFTPAMAAVSAAGDLWVTDVDNGRVVVFDANDTKKKGEVKTGPGAHAIAFSPDGKRAFVSNQEDASLTFIDAEKVMAVRTVKVGAKPNGVLFRAASANVDVPMGGDLFNVLLKPLLTADVPSSCAQCHLGGTNLKQYLKATHKETFKSLVDAGLVVPGIPNTSKVLEFILMEPELASVDTTKLRQKEFLAFSRWIEASLRDDGTLSTAAQPVVSPPPTAVPTIDPQSDVTPSPTAQPSPGATSTPTAQPTATPTPTNAQRNLTLFTASAWTEIPARCQSCHSAQGANGQKGPLFVIQENAAQTLTNIIQTGLINPSSRSQSLLRLKPTGQVAHGGGTKFAAGDATDIKIMEFLNGYLP